MRISRELALLRWSCHYEGPFVTLLRIAGRLAARFGWDVTSSDTFQRLVERSFDRRYGVETAGYTPPDQLPVTAEQAAEAVAYSATSSAKFGYLLARLPIEFEQSTFIDIGCGKGRVLFMASEFPFRRVMGVDFAANLVEAAVANSSHFLSRRQRCRDISAICGDATEFPFPDEPLVVYFYNPFSAVILRPVLERLGRSLDASPRPAWIIYYNPVEAALFDEFPSFVPFDREDCVDPRWRVYRWESPAKQSHTAMKSESHVGAIPSEFPG